LRETASREGMTLVTTEKDAVRLDVSKGDIVILPVELSLSNDTLMSYVVKAMIHRRSAL
jgi:tetraacyldisaccharide-1-P 4'-kinase